jgi:hypothetical protein
VNVFARRRSSLDLLLVLAVGRCENDDIDFGIGQDRLKIVDQAHAFAPAEVFRFGVCARMRKNKANVVGFVLDRVDERTSPSPQSNDGCAYHVVLSSWRHSAEMPITSWRIRHKISAVKLSQPELQCS